ncbi:hypothetical protein KC351_g742 [Hortaea werneckii]|nr:hypothetical protein KC351_g742 [Hortaea werneckii]
MSSRSTSPDPITLPSSPLAAHSVRASSAIPLAPRSPNKFSSPSKSFLLDAGGVGATGKAGVSPWRLRVTVEPEFMREASLSPTKARRAGVGRKNQGSVDAHRMAVQQKVPLRDVEQEGGSPLKQTPRRRRRATPAKVRPEEAVGGEIEVRRPARKRKGTPIRRHGAREKMARQDDEDDEEQEGEDDLFGTTTPPSADLHRSRQQKSLILPSQAAAAAAPPSHHSPQHLQVPSSSSRPTSRTSAKSKDKRRSSLQPYHFRDKDGTLRTARLSQAREELDTALQDALGYSDEIFSPSAYHDYHHSHHSEAERRDDDDDDDDDDEAEPDHQPDENTVSINEDFTMVSVETLQSMKTGGGGGEGETSLVSHHRHSRSVHPGEKSRLSVSYLPSSPPKEDFPAAHGGGDGDAGGGEGQGTEMEGAVLVGEMDGHTSIATRAQGREERGEEVSESEREEESGRDEDVLEEVGGYDVMSWKPTGPAKRVDSHNHLIHQAEPEQKDGGIEYSLSEVESGEDDDGGDAHSVHHDEGADDAEEEAEEEEEQDSPAQLGAQQSPPQDRSPSTNNNDNKDDTQADEDDDIWYEEASRSLDQDVEAEEGEGNQSFSKASSRRQYNPNRSQPPTDNSETRRDTGPNNMQDLFANQPNKPPRAKIPRTWRRSSGMDFLYSDSPAREPEVGRRDPESMRKRKHDGEEVEEGGHEKRKTSRKRRAGGGADMSAEGEATDRSSGVLTPPSSGAEDGGRGAAGGGEGGEGDSSLVSLEEDRRRAGNKDEGNEDEEEEGDFTYPDAAATGIHFDDDEGDEGRTAEVKAFPGRRRARPNAPPKKPLPSHSNDTTAVDDTGIYWQNPNLPHPCQATHGQAQESEQDSSSLLPAAEKPAGKFPGRRRPRPRDGMMVKKAMDLSELLGMGGEKEGESSLDEGPKAQGGEESVDESYESKASDQRQLLGEMSARGVKVGRGPGLREVVSHGQESFEDFTPEEEEVDDDATHDRFTGEESTFRSYEEFLNRESPTKVQVKFGDSLNSSLLAPKKEYSSLFSQGAAQRQTQPISQPPPVVPSTERQQPLSIAQQMRKQQEGPSLSLANAPQGILDRLTSNFWSALIRPTGPTEVLPETSRQPSTSTTTAPNPLPTQNNKRTPSQPSQPNQSYPTTLRTRLRSRYGVLSASHPWTLAHMRTLHRMLNSATSGKSDSVIPGPTSSIYRTSQSFSNTTTTSTSSAPASAVALSPYLSSLVSHEQTSFSGKYVFVFTEIHAQVVEAFMAILVPDAIICAIEKGEIDGLGDSTARQLRGWYGGRWGGDVRVWEGMEDERRGEWWGGWGRIGGGMGGKKGGRKVREGEGIEEAFVVAALGDCVGWNERGG